MTQFTVHAPLTYVATIQKYFLKSFNQFFSQEATIQTIFFIGILALKKIFA